MSAKIRGKGGIMTNALITSTPFPTAAGLEGYLQEIKSHPILSKEKETKLALQFRDTGDLNAARQLVLSHLRLVVSIAKNHMGYGLPFADLIQEGNVGLMKAVRRYDPGKGVRLVSFAIHWIKAEINEYVIRNWRLIKIATTKAQRKLFFNLRSFRKDGKTLKPKEVNEIAKSLGVNVNDVLNMEKRFSEQETSLDLSSDDEAPLNSFNQISNPKDEPQYILEKKQWGQARTRQLLEALEKLPSRSRRIITARWLGEGKSVTLQTLSKELGISAERVRQIEVQAMEKLKSYISATE